MNFADLLFADLDATILKIVFFVVFLIIAGISQLLAKIRQMQPPANRPNPPPGQPDVADEIEEFMRRAAERRATRKPRPVAMEPSRPAAEPVRAEVVAERSLGGNVNEHVTKYLSEEDFSRRESRLGSEVAQADEQISQHLREVFDHRVSKLETVGGETAKATTAYEPPDLVGTGASVPDSFATGLLDLMTSPESLRQAIILNEILHRPEERWT